MLVEPAVKSILIYKWYFDLACSTKDAGRYNIVELRREYFVKYTDVYFVDDRCSVIFYNYTLPLSAIKIQLKTSCIIW
jgi:hypothetical protein